MRASLSALALGTALVLSARAQAPVGPVPPKPATPPSVAALQKLIDGAASPVAAQAWSARTAEDQQRIYDELKSLTDQIKKGMGLPIGPVAPVAPKPIAPPSGGPPPVTPPPPDPKKPGPPPSKQELDAVLNDLSGALEAGQQKSPSFSPAETVRLQQLLNGLQKPPS